MKGVRTDRITEGFDKIERTRNCKHCKGTGWVQLLYSRKPCECFPDRDVMEKIVLDLTELLNEEDS